MRLTLEETQYLLDESTQHLTARVAAIDPEGGIL